MFNLNLAIEEWCQSIRASDVMDEASIDTIKDRLDVEMERLKEAGLSEEQAFRTATERIEKAEGLQIELSNNRNALPNELSKTISNLLPTITLAIGMLFGGLIGAYLGSFANTDFLSAACYVAGALAGAVCGTLIGYRWRSHRSQNLSHV